MLAVFGLRLAPALTAAAIVASHTTRVGDGVLVAAMVLIATRALDPGRRCAQLMPAAGLIAAMIAPLAGIALAWFVCLVLNPLPADTLLPAALGTGLVTALGAWIVVRFEHLAEVRIAVVGGPGDARELAHELSATRTGGYRVAGWIDRGTGAATPGVRRLGALGETAGIVARERIDLIVDAGSNGGAASVADACVGLDVRLIGLNRLHEDVIGHVPLATLDSAFFQYLMHPKYRAGSPAVKRATDLAGAGLGAIVLAPAVAIAALVSRLGGRPAFTRERRVGAGGREFDLLHLRTGDGGLGHALRRTRLAAAPMLWNVIRGQMSLVGPRAERPGLVADLEWELPFYDRRELVKPGLTGWAQLRSASRAAGDSSWALCHDLYYLKHRSTALDAMILLQTAATAGHGFRLPRGAADEAVAQAN